METKEQLIKEIREWVKIDNEIRTLQKETNNRKNEKKNITNNLINIMKSHQIDCFDIKDGQLLYTKRNIKKPITKKNLMSILSNYYNGNTDKAMDLNNFIMENRDEVVKETITRKIFTDEI
jgi:hypothetical protein